MKCSDINLTCLTYYKAYIAEVLLDANGNMGGVTSIMGTKVLWPKDVRIVLTPPEINIENARKF